FGGAPEEGDGGQEPGGGGGHERGGGPGSAAGSGGGARPGGDRLLQLPGQQRGQALVGAVAHVQPQGGAVVDQQQRPAGVQQGGDRARRVTGEVLPDAFAQGHLGEFAVPAEPLLHLGEGEGRAGPGAADGPGEVGVAAAPVADGGPADAGEPGDPGGGHPTGAVLPGTVLPRAVLPG